MKINHSNHAKTVIAIRVTVIVIERKHSCTRTSVKSVTTFEPRIAEVDKPPENFFYPKQNPTNKFFKRRKIILKIPIMAIWKIQYIFFIFYEIIVNSRKL